MNLRAGIAGALLSVCLGWLGAGVARAAEPTIEQDLLSAESAYGTLDYEDSSHRAELLIRRGGLSHDELVRAYRVLALSRSSMGDAEKAREAFIQLLTYDPDHKVDRGLGPKVEQPYLEAMGFWRNQLQQPGVDASVGALRPGVPATLHVVTRDPTHIVKTVTVAWRFGATAPFETAHLAAGAQSVAVRAPVANESRFDYYVQALDTSDSVAFEVGTPQTPRTALVEIVRSTRVPGPERREASSIFSSPVFWVATAIVVAGGTAATYLLVSRDPDERTLPPTSANVGPILFCGAERCR